MNDLKGKKKQINKQINKETKKHSYFFHVVTLFNCISTGW